MSKKPEKEQSQTLDGLIDFFEKNDKAIGGKVGIVFVSEYKEVAPKIKVPLALYAEFELKPTNPMQRVTRKDVFNLLKAINEKYPVLQVILQRPVELEPPKEVTDAINKYKAFRAEMVKNTKQHQCSGCSGPCEHKDKRE